MPDPVRISAASQAAQRAVEYQCLGYGAQVLAQRRAAIEADFRRRGIDFLADGAAGYFRRPQEQAPIHLDPIPYALTVADWARIGHGYRQRLAVFDDLIRAMVDRDESVLPRHTLESCAYDRAALAVLAQQPRVVSYAGSDAMIDERGWLWLVEDNPCAAGGCVYGALVSETTHRLVPDLAAFRGDAVIEVGPAIRRAHEELCDTVGTPRMVYVTHGPGDPNFVENIVVAESAGFVLADPEDLSVGPDATVWLRRGNGTRKSVDLVYCSHSRRFRLSADLLDAVAKRTARVVNHPATFALADKFLFPCVGDLVVRRFGAPTLLGQARTIALHDPTERAAIFADIREYVVKPRKGLGGKGVLVGATATDEAIRQMRERVDQRPHDYLAQPRVVATTTLALSRGESFIRSVFDIRVSGYLGLHRVAVPEPLVRADLNGAGLVNLSAGGAQKAMYRIHDGSWR
jgi:uncharacterized circularly permuted ATP-grasp superfamily protein